MYHENFWHGTYTEHIHCDTNFHRRSWKVSEIENDPVITCLLLFVQTCLVLFINNVFFFSFVNFFLFRKLLSNSSIYISHTSRQSGRFEGCSSLLFHLAPIVSFTRCRCYSEVLPETSFGDIYFSWYAMKTKSISFHVLLFSFFSLINKKFEQKLGKLILIFSVHCKKGNLSVPSPSALLTSWLK